VFTKCNSLSSPPDGTNLLSAAYEQQRRLRFSTGWIGFSLSGLIAVMKSDESSPHCMHHDDHDPLHISINQQPVFSRHPGTQLEYLLLPGIVGS